MSSKALLVLLAACGDPAPVANDAAVPLDAPGACTAHFTGNFIDTTTTADACATDGLAISIASPFLDGPLQITIPATAPGELSSQTVTAWSATASRTVEHDACLLAAGDQVVPHGAFTLHLVSVSPPHGTLVLDQAVRATTFATCGDPLVEHVEVTF